jgi:hypothetical protein
MTIVINGTNSPTAGSIGYGDGTNLAFTAAGTTGQVLTSATAGTPTWAAPSAGSLVLLSTVTASNSATVDVETTFSSTYDTYMLVVSGATPTVDSAPLLMLMKIGGTYISTSTYITSASASASSSTFDTKISVSSTPWGNDAPSSLDVVMYVFNPSSTAFRKLITFQAVGSRLDTGVMNIQARSGSAANSGTDALTGLRFYATSGNINAGKFRLYGIVNS